MYVNEKDKEKKDTTKAQQLSFSFITNFAFLFLSPFVYTPLPMRESLVSFHIYIFKTLLFQVLDEIDDTLPRIPNGTVPLMSDVGELGVLAFAPDAVRVGLFEGLCVCVCVSVCV